MYLHCTQLGTKILNLNVDNNIGIIIDRQS